MPTAGKAVGAVLFALLGAAVTLMVAADLPGVLRGAAPTLCGAGLGAVLGWRMTGRRDAGLARGLGAAALWVLGATVTAAVAAMLDRAVGGRYRGLPAALEDAARLAFEMAGLLVEPATVGLVLVGGGVGGLVAQRVARRLP
jgi:hypothetical protein